MSYPDDNPKTAVGVTKVPLHLVPPASIHGEAEALADGAEKYGPYNWREFDISASTYIAATLRHIHAWWDGENVAHDSLVHHIKHAKATLGIMLDAMTLGKLKDDRPPPGACPEMQRAYARQKALDEATTESQQPRSYDPDQYLLPYGGTV